MCLRRQCNEFRQLTRFCKRANVCARETSQVEPCLFLIIRFTEPFFRHCSRKTRRIRGWIPYAYCASRLKVNDTSKELDARRETERNIVQIPPLREGEYQSISPHHLSVTHMLEAGVKTGTLLPSEWLCVRLRCWARLRPADPSCPGSLIRTTRAAALNLG